LVACFGFTFFVHAQTWSAPVGSPPTNNVPGPINIGSSTQFKLGALGVGETTSSSTNFGTASGFSFEVNGPVSVNGLASFGANDLEQATHIGPLNTCSICYSTANQATLYTAATPVPASGGNPTYTVPYSGGSYTLVSGTSYEYTPRTNLALNNKNSTLSGMLDKLGGLFADIFNPSQAYASFIGNDNGPIVDPVQIGPCYGNWCNSEQYCDNVTEACASMGTTLASGQTDVNTGIANTNFTTVTGNTTGGSSGGSDPGTLYGLPTTIGFTSKRADLVAELSLSSIPASGTFTPTLATTTTGTVTLHWHVASAASCKITSANPDKNLDITPALNPAGFGDGYYAIDYISASPGSYTYTLTCSPAVQFFNPRGSSTSVTVIVGSKYIMQVNGNTNIEGYIVANGNIATNGGFIEHGKRVCLEDGTDCPTNSATNIINPINQGGSLELGANNLVNSNGQTPYIDFHYGNGSNATNDYNFRMINDGDGNLDVYTASGFVLSINNNGLNIGYGKHLRVCTNSICSTYSSY